MATQEKVYIIPSFDAGVQTKSSSFLKKQNELKLAKNVDLQAMFGAICKAPGYTQLGDEIASSRTLLGCGALNSSSYNKILAFANKAGSGADAYVYNSATGAWSAQSRSYTADQSFETESFLDMLFVVNGLTDAPETYTGAAWSTSTNVTDMPKARYIKVYENRLFLYNITLPVGGSFPSRVWYCDLPKNNAIVWDFESGADLASTSGSAVVTSATAVFKTRGIKAGDPIFITTGTNAGEYEIESVDSETQLTLTQSLSATESSKSFWCGGNWFDVARDNSDIGKGLAINADRLLCFKRFSLYRFLKTPDAVTDSLTPIKGAPGTVSNRGIVNIGKYTFYPSDTGIWRYDGVESLLASSPIQEVWDGVSSANYSSIFGWAVNDRTLKMYVGDVSNTNTGLTINKCVMVYDLIMNTWWTESIADTLVAGSQWLNGNSLQNFVFGNGECFQTESGGSFDGTEIDMDAETDFYFPISPEVSANITRVKFYTQYGRAINFQYKLAYYTDPSGQQIDSEWRTGAVIDHTEYETNIRINETDNFASGIAFKFREISSTLAKIAISRAVVYYTGGELR